MKAICQYLKIFLDFEFGSFATKCNDRLSRPWPCGSLHRDPAGARIATLREPTSRPCGSPHHDPAGACIATLREPTSRPCGSLHRDPAGAHITTLRKPTYGLWRDYRRYPFGHRCIKVAKKHFYFRFYVGENEAGLYFQYSLKHYSQYYLKFYII